ncbi:MAG: hypothetical protein Q8Q41_04870 [bacterium]|nr:hypothetical protein [bacterium]
MRWYLCLIAVALPFFTPGGVTMAAGPMPVTLSGGDLPHAIRLAAVDADAFARRVDLPPKLKTPPSPLGPSYQLETPYWDSVLRGSREDRPPAAAVAVYYPSAGVVKARQGDDDVWLVLDLRQRAIIDRYVRLGWVLSAAPGVMEVLGAAAVAGEEISVQVGTKTLDAAEAARFWAGVAGLQPRAYESSDPANATDAPDTVWIIFGLAEGRSVQLLYAAADGLLIDAIGSQVYAVPPSWLVPVLGPQAAAGPGFALSAGSVPQEAGTGSPLWWVVMIGGGLALLGATVWLQRLLGPNDGTASGGEG